MPIRKSVLVITIGLLLSLYGVAHSKSAWRRVDSGTQYFFTSISAPDSLNLWVAGGVILRSTDGGNSWGIQFDSLPSYISIGIVAFADSLNGWALGELCCSVPISYRTSDGGRTWNRLSCPTANGPNAQQVRAVSFIDTLSGWLAMDGDTVYRTRDAGLTWTPNFVGVSGFSPFQIQFVDSLHGWLGGLGNDGLTPLLYSSDGGRNWEIQSLNLNDTLSRVIDLDFIDRKMGWLLMAVAGQRIYRTTDGGTNWTATHGEADGPIRKALDFVDESKGWIAGTKFFGGFVSVISNSMDSGRSFVDTLIQEGSSAQKIKMFNENIGWAVDALGGILKYAPLVLGDVNWDGNLTLTDVVLELNKVFLDEPFPAPEQMGDVNCDARFSAADIVWLLRRVFLQRPFPCSL